MKVRQLPVTPLRAREIAGQGAGVSRIGTRRPALLAVVLLLACLVAMAGFSVAAFIVDGLVDVSVGDRWISVGRWPENPRPVGRSAAMNHSRIYDFAGGAIDLWVVGLGPFAAQLMVRKAGPDGVARPALPIELL